MYKILLVDDFPQILHSLKEKLSSFDMEIYACRRIAKANDTWNKKKDELNAIVIDMMMPSTGIDEDIRPKTQGGLLSGWKWLWRILSQDDIHTHLVKNKCIIIYSAYLDDFDEYINSKQADDEEKQFVKNHVKRIPKGFSYSDEEKELINYLINDRNNKAKVNS
jgi:CheY-like chemotaxis protein